jgi:hypothetical protein
MKIAKNTTSIKLAIVSLALVSGLYSCQKSGVSPASTTGPKISFGVSADKSFAGAAATPGTAAAAIKWTAGNANISKFEFEATKGGVKTSIETRGLQNVDLFALTPVLADTKIDTGTYSQIEVKIEFAKSGSALPLSVQGNFTSSGGTVIPVEIDVNDSFEVKAESKQVFIDKTTDLKTFVKLHLDKVLAGITVADLEAATLTSGKMIISSTSNVGLFNKIKLNVAQSGENEFEGEHEHNGDSHGHGGNESDG